MFDLNSALKIMFERLVAADWNNYHYLIYYATELIVSQELYCWTFMFPNSKT